MNYVIAVTIILLALVFPLTAQAKVPALSPSELSLPLGGLSPEVKQALRVVRRAVNAEYARRMDLITPEYPPGIEQWFWNEWWMRRLDLKLIRDYLLGVGLEGS